MPLTTGLDASSRFEAFVEAYGAAGVGALILVGALAVIFLAVRGTGFTLLLLLLSYSVVFMPIAGVGTAAFFLRSLALLLLAVGAIRHLVIPGWPFFALLMYVILGYVFSANSPDVMWSLQSATLLLVTTLGVMLGVSQYLTSFDKISPLFHMFVASGAVWTVASIAFIPRFLMSAQSRFAGGSDIHATNYAAVGAVLFPFMLWAAVQRRQLIWRVIGMIGVLGIPICFFLSGTRTAIVVAAIASGPLLFRDGASRSLRVWILLGAIGFGAVYIGKALVQHRSTKFLQSRLLSTSLTGREERWAGAWDIVAQSPVMGRGIGSNDTLAKQQGRGLFHNAYLAVWCNTGLLGLILVTSVLVSQTWRAFALMRHVKDPRARDAMRLATGVLLAIMAMGLVDNAIASPSNAIVVTFLVILTLVNRVNLLSSQVGVPARTRQSRTNPRRINHQRGRRGMRFVKPATRS